MKTSADGGAADDGDPAPRPFFHEGMRAWQDRFDSWRLADAWLLDQQVYGNEIDFA